ncbi:heme lyase CcmF/NrfE family subunit [Aestuariispira insulae]|uniref:Cytochrome c-type biogenesis protein CcmF n=1 Tax=Aestuariispira insulae TaxID=1461337 RepID=A0A3D9HQ12_9PROT|nr:heme lyase CcmF/NrfE family subunit [Aestuariispira insulae]RED51560.1 cytochrome c-type biogenesis protein CcmF [Aestuariispira insulae]
MIAEIGHFALILALMVAVVQGTVPFIAAAKNHMGGMRLASSAAIAQFLCLAVSFAALTHAYVTSDFSLLNVVNNSHSLKPLLYKVAGVWGNHEGSLLLWVLTLTLFGLLVAVFGRALPPGLKSRTLAVQGLISVGFLIFVLFTSNPFERIPVPPLEGGDLNPLLQDPGLAFHPPMLYLGYVGLSITYSFAVAALIEGKVDAAWARWVRPWALLAWVFLTGGIALGSWWAYYELGWGGFWFWDPVENASFMPWLIATALMHSAIVVEKRDTLKSWTILLAIVGFSMSLIGTFLVRSGVLTSVHAFANDPERGVFILLLLMISIGGSLLIYAWRAPNLQGGGYFKLVSREGALVFNNMLLTVITALVFLFTLAPLIFELFEKQITVGPPMFNFFFVPLTTILVLALGVGPLLAWKRGDWADAKRRLRLALLLTLILTALSAIVVWGRDAYALVGVALAIWLTLAVIVEMAKKAGWPRQSLSGTLRRAIRLPRASWGMTVAHIGVAVVIAGATGASLLTVDKTLSMRPGDRTTIAGFEIEFTGAEEVNGPNYIALRGHYTAYADGQAVSRFEPERRRYIANGQQTTEAAIETHSWYDLYVVIGDQTKNGGYVTRLYHKPLAPWLWLGSILMMLGGILSLTDRRLRVGAPRRAAAPIHQPAE